MRERERERERERPQFIIERKSVPFLLIRNVCVDSTMTLSGSQHHLSCTLRWVGGSQISSAVEKRKEGDTLS